MSFCSHTLVRQGMPFIEPVLRQVIPFADRCLITVSKKSTDGTLEVVEKLVNEFPTKVYMFKEDVNKPKELTHERQKLLDRTTEDWILFLDSDDLWPTESIKKVLKYLGENVDAFAFNPYQVINEKVYDASWKNKHFTKWFRNQSGLHYEKPWPRDLIFVDDRMLYWKKNKRVKRLPIRYFHLANLMKWRFRDEKWAKKYKINIGKKKRYPETIIDEVIKIYSYMDNNH